MTKTTAISLMILEAIRNGQDVAEAIDSVLGAGTYAAIASDIYDSLRK